MLDMLISLGFLKIFIMSKFLFFEAAFVSLTRLMQSIYGDIENLTQLKKSQYLFGKKRFLVVPKKPGITYSELKSSYYVACFEQV